MNSTVREPHDLIQIFLDIHQAHPKGRCPFNTVRDFPVTRENFPFLCENFPLTSPKCLGSRQKIPVSISQGIAA